MSDQPPFDLAVIALSARALARSARRAGLHVLAFDLFADADTREHAAEAVRIPMRRGVAAFDRRALLGALANHAPEGLPVVLGAGFEHAPNLMRAIARRNPVIGASSETVAALKDPEGFAQLLAELRIPHPSLLTAGSRALNLSPVGRGRRVAPGEGASTSPDRAAPPHPPTLARRRPLPTGDLCETPARFLPPSPLRGGVGGGGGSEKGAECEAALRATASLQSEPPPPLPSPQGGGAGGVAPFAEASTGERCTEGAAPNSEGINWLSKRAGASGGAHIRVGAAQGARRYLQERVEGRAISALFLADGAKAQVLGFSEQWTDPAPTAPFRYGGAAGPVPVSDDLQANVASTLDRLVSATRLKGLASADMILPDDQNFVLLEINPRPGATLDVFDRGDMPALINLHIEACAGRLPGPLPRLETAFAAAIVHAPATTRAGAVARPHWTADWPSCDETVPAGAPFCTVFAGGQDPLGARRLLEERRDALLARLPSARVPAPTNQKW